MDKNYDNIYEKISVQDSREMHRRNYEIQKRMDEYKENPYKNIVKVGTYKYVEPPKKQNEYEKKVNEILEEINIPEQQSNVDELINMQQQMRNRTNEILNKNSAQSKVNSMIDKGDER